MAEAWNQQNVPLRSNWHSWEQMTCLIFLCYFCAGGIFPLYSQYLKGSRLTSQVKTQMMEKLVDNGKHLRAQAWTTCLSSPEKTILLSSAYCICVGYSLVSVEYTVEMIFLKISPPAPFGGFYCFIF